VGRKTGRLAHTDIDGGLAEVDRHELRVKVGQVDQRHVAEALEIEQVVLRQRLLRRRPRPLSGKPRAGNGRQRRTGHQKFASRKHASTLAIKCRSDPRRSLFRA